MILGVETPDGPYSLKAQYVIAADGGHGALRELIGAQDEERSFYEDRWCIADVRMDAKEEAIRKAYLDGIPTQGGAIWYHQMADGIWRTDWQIGHLPDADAEATPERATARLRKMVGPGVRFELVWVGPWRFKKRLLGRFLHGRILFAGDAARDNTENATRSAIFIGPATAGQRLFRDAILDLAQRHEWARAWVNVGRLSVATTYGDSCLNRQRGSFESRAAAPGAAAPDGRFGESFFVDELQGQFTVALEALWRAAGGRHVRLAARRACARALHRHRRRLCARRHPGGVRLPGEDMTQLEMDRLYDELSGLIDRTPADRRERVLARLVIALAHEVGDYAKLKAAIEQEK